MKDQYVSLDADFSKYAEALGGEVKASEQDAEWQHTMHYYAGLTVTEDKDGKIDSILLSDETGKNDEIAFMGKLSLGMKAEDAKAILGEPDREDAYSMFYTGGDPWVYIYLDESTGEITGIFLTRAVS